MNRVPRIAVRAVFFIWVLLVLYSPLELLRLIFRHCGYYGIPPYWDEVALISFGIVGTIAAMVIAMIYIIRSK